MNFVVVTGMSGGGKRTAMKMLEDMGYYCVDNLPAPLVGTFVELIGTPNSEITKVALGLDARSDKSFVEIQNALEKVREAGFHYDILFMDANDTVLINRYKESRRKHPINGEGSLEASIKAERKILEQICNQADYVVDTSHLLTRDLKAKLEAFFVRGGDDHKFLIQLVSFGFKNGIPREADLVFDVRFLPNPFYIEELKFKTGNDQDVRDYVMQFKEANEFLQKLYDLLVFLLPNYIREGKYKLIVAIGCTGGKHRSATLANMLYQKLIEDGVYDISIHHRDIKQG